MSENEFKGIPINKNLLIEFLNTLFVGKYTITDLTYLNNEHTDGCQEDRRAIFDIHCEPQRAYEDSSKADKDRVNAVIAAWIEGYVEGYKEGLKKGERKKQLEIARQMKSDGMPMDIILKYTGLSEKDMEE